jgi:fumarylacetoacetase
MPERSSGGDDLFGPHNLPYGVFTTADEPGRRRLGVRLHDRVLDAGAAARVLGSPYEALLAHPDLGPLMAAGRTAWRDVRRALTGWVTVPAHRAELEPLLHPLDEVALHLPYRVADYADFYSNEHHAANGGAILRPGGQALPPNWKHLPVGYHGRAGTVVVSGTDVVRPTGQRKTPTGQLPVFGPSTKLDIEAEVGFVVGTPSPQGTPVPMAAFRDHVFGLCLLNDWSARDIQAWESQPLGPFLGKSFTTSVSPWVVTAEALAPYRIPAYARPAGDPAPLPHLTDKADQAAGGIDITLEVLLMTDKMRAAGHKPFRLSHGSFATIYWTIAQMVAHHTSNGCNVQIGDLMATGTCSGPQDESRGCLLEITSRGRQPVALPNGETRAFLQDGDEVIFRASCEGAGRARIGFGECTGAVLPART